MHAIPRTFDSRPCARTGISALIIALAALGAAVGKATAAPCPPSIVHLERGLSPPSTITDPVYDSTLVVEVVDSFQFAAHVAFDRTQGRLSVTADSWGRLNAQVRVVERFDVIGVPAGTQVPATMEFRLDGWSQQNCGGSGCGVRLEGTLVAAPDSVTADADQQGPGYRRVDLAQTLSLPVTFVAGSPIEAQFFLDFGTGPGQTDAHVELDGSYRVSALPGGVHAIACSGADVTPARRATWGMLKSIYR
jgi:hypothetical protein